MAIELLVHTRSDEPARRIRARGRIPATIYGGAQNFQIEVDTKSFDSVFRQVATHGVITLKLPDGKKRDVLVKQVQTHPLRRVPIHADFYEVGTSKVRVRVPIHLAGKPKALREGATLAQSLRELEVEVTPADIPAQFVVDVAEMEINQSIHVSAVVVPPKVKLLTDPTQTIVTLTPPRVSEEVTTAVPEAAPVAVEPEVIKRGKEDEEESSQEG